MGVALVMAGLAQWIMVGRFIRVGGQPTSSFFSSTRRVECLICDQPSKCYLFCVLWVSFIAMTCRGSKRGVAGLCKRGVVRNARRYL